MSTKSAVVISNDHPRLKLRRIFLEEKTHAPALLAIAIKLIGIEGVQTYDPMTIRLELQDELRIKDLPNHAFDQLMAAINLLNTDMFFTDVYAFNELCNVLSGQRTSPSMFEPCDPLEMAWAVAQARMIDPLDGENSGLEFTEDVKLYMGVILSENGFVSPPYILREAIMPPEDDATASTYIGDAEMLPAILESGKSRVLELESNVAIYMDELKSQLNEIISITKVG